MSSSTVRRPGTSWTASKLDRVYVAIAECLDDGTDLLARAGDAVRDLHGSDMQQRDDSLGAKFTKAPREMQRVSRWVWLFQVACS